MHKSFNIFTDYIEAKSPLGNLLTLSGFMTAVIINPEEISEKHWLGYILAEGEDRGFDNEEQKQQVLSEIQHFFNFHEKALTGKIMKPSEFFDAEPGSDEWKKQASAWCGGLYMGANTEIAPLIAKASLAEKQLWGPVLAASGLMDGHFADQEGLAMLKEQAFENVDELAQILFKHYRDEVETQAVKPPGRNDPCPCGSGKKFKKCHGATD